MTGHKITWDVSKLESDPDRAVRFLAAFVRAEHGWKSDDDPQLPSTVTESPLELARRISGIWAVDHVPEASAPAVGDVPEESPSGPMADPIIRIDSSAEVERGIFHVSVTRVSTRKDILRMNATAVQELQGELERGEANGPLPSACARRRRTL